MTDRGGTFLQLFIDVIDQFHQSIHCSIGDKTDTLIIYHMKSVVAND